MKYCIFIIFSLILGCYKDDFHPNLIKGTTFYADEGIGLEKSIIITPLNTNCGDVIIKDKKYIYEYYFLSFYFNRLIGTYNNGELYEIIEKDLALINNDQDKVVFVEIENTQYRTMHLLDLLNDYLPGGLFRINRFILYYKIKSLPKNQLNCLTRMRD